MPPTVVRRLISFSLILAAAGTASAASPGINRAPLPALNLVTGGIIDRLAYALDGAESSHGADPRMWRSPPDGPQGPMQVTAAAAADVGGGDRFDETQNRALGRAYLAHMYRRYGSWPDAVAAYNWGPGRMDSWISGGRPADKLPVPVQRYRNRVLLTSGLVAGLRGLEPDFSELNPRLVRLGMLRAEAKRELIARQRRGNGRDVVELLYADIMRATAVVAR